jgi:hypothetical protein
MRNQEKDLGFVLTKAPLESPGTPGMLKAAHDAMKRGRSAALFC